MIDADYFALSSVIIFIGGIIIGYLLRGKMELK